MIYQDAVKTDYEPSLHDINKEDQENNKNKQGQKLSGTISMGRKILFLWYSSSTRQMSYGAQCSKIIS